ncbi:MAG: glycosyltransferase family 4 protein [Nitrospirales bacterium]|nr:glycosyltransferase family 4 protein [Nitrospirales bacterium]
MTILEMSTESSVQMAFIVPLAQHLRKQGHQVVLACSDDPGEAGQSFVETLRRMGFEVLVLPLKRTIAPWSDLRATVELYRHLRRRRFDVVHTQTAKAGMVGRIAAFLARVPVIVYTAHAFPFHEYLSPWRIRLYSLLERLASLLCHAIAVDSECVRSRGLAFHVAPPEKIRVIPMGIDTERFDPGKYRAERAAIRVELGLRPDATVIGAVARFVPDKGLDVLLQTVSLLAKRFPDLQCLLTGDGPLKEDLRNLSRTLGLEGRVLFAGYRTDIPRVLSAMDLYMLPTRREGFGVAFAEAMSMEVPVIASRIPPLDEIVADGHTGALADVGSPDAFARAAEPLLADPDLRRKMGQAARQRVLERFEQLLMCRAYERLFQDCAAR